MACAAVAPPNECPKIPTLETSRRQLSPGMSLLAIEGLESSSKTKFTSLTRVSSARGTSASVIFTERAVELSGNVTISAS